MDNNNNNNNNNNNGYGAIPLSDVSQSDGRSAINAAAYPKRSHVFLSAFVGAVLSLILITSLYFFRVFFFLQGRERDS